MPRPTKIEESLSAEELLEFFQLLAKERNLTGARIQELAEDRGIKIGHNSAAKFKSGPFAAWLEKIQKRKTAAEFMAANHDGTEGATLSDALAAGMASDLVELQMAGDLTLDLTSEEGIEKAKALSLVIHRLRTGDRSMQKELREVRAKLEEVEKTMAAAEKKGTGLSPEAMQQLREKLGWQDLSTQPPAKEAAAA